MDDSIESDLLAAHSVRFAGDEAAWIDAYVVSTSRIDPMLAPVAAHRAAIAAWKSNGWAHPAVVAHFEHALGALSAD